MGAKIQDAFTAFNTQFLEACAGNDITGAITGSLLRFLEIPNLPPYYRFTANVALSDPDEQDEPEETLAACRYHLGEAERAMADCKDVYKDPGDVQVSQRPERVLKGEWAELEERQKNFDD